jgi:molybdopterin/thiamine biosynthesis adenylyltransferase
MPLFVYENELIKLEKTSEQEGRQKAVALEYPGEGIIHLHLDRPPSTPVGYPLQTLIHCSRGKKPSKSSIETDIRNLSETCRNFVYLVITFSGKKAPQLQAWRFQEDALDLLEVTIVPAEVNDFSRSKGLLETDALSGKSATIVGLGSFGAPIAIELAKAGLGTFHLYDYDRLEGANLNRHPCGIDDLGRLKVNAVSDTMLRKNPYLKIHTFPVDVNTALDSLGNSIENTDITICVTDEKRSRINVNQQIVAARKPAVFSRAITRAAGGDVFRYTPGNACLACLFGQGFFQKAEEVSTEKQAKRDAPAYMSESDIEAQVQVGLSVDILPIVQMTIKLALVELCKGTELPMTSVEEDLSCPFYIWANRRDLIYRDWKPMKSYYNRNSIMRWYGVNVPKDDSCLCCSLV